MQPMCRILGLISVGMFLAGCSGQPENIPQNVRSRALEVQTLARLRNLGLCYTAAAQSGRLPRNFEDLLENTERVPNQFKSARDQEEFEVIWNVNLNNLKEATNTLLAWEKTPDGEGGRCVLMADCQRCVYLNKAEFDKALKAKGR